MALGAICCGHDTRCERLSMPGTALFEKPRWLRDLLRFLPLKSQFVLSGNIRDLQACEVVPGTVTAQSFNQTLCDALLDAGYAQVLAWDPLAGFRVLGRPGSEAGATPQVLLDLGLTPVDGAAPAGIDLLGATLQRLVNRSGEPIALIVDFASRLAVRNDALSAAEHQLFTQALVLSHQARSRPAGEQRKPFFNSVLWVVEKEGDLPDWLLVDNPRLRHIPVSKPDQPARRALAPALLRGLGGAGVAEEALQQAAATFVENTEGLLLLDLNAIVQLARVEGLAMERIADAVRRYKVGVTEAPWLKIDRQRIRQADEIVRRRVKGQQHAVTHMLDIVKRAMTGVGASRKGNRPRGVAFLAGPTGVGKTELAKTVTSLLFGDESAYIRFDMSEFSAEHADQRLIGAPPGYVGYDVGGELTNAIREKPFSVVLFDEIEKAHPRILDKFLQILDDGVLTSGRGDRVYFSEALIVFTSNLGIYRQGENGERVANVLPGEPFEAVQGKVHGEIERYFKLVLNRPEILNRIGENIIVFDFIRADVAEQIFTQMVDGTFADLREQRLVIELAEAPRQALHDLCLGDLSNGGRGIRNQLEARLLNPLSRALFDQDAQPGERFLISALDADGLTLERR
ncbi:AAA family ATPase [Pseudomonas aeruginosa]|nr:ATP-dependent Clp protease ATP-binding subunit [Pseudomonas aeruginosa]EKU4265376.1 ATP-dependent Clp protease ATP-binding subunit [Pseudomonas aeruginosa]EKV8028248.1 ATP-dependent Clp protease ATP-binding subunit [Pseudomonas aeruginosa]EKV8786171.1 ATP-dependent Clp protease ATP-binding subunit [Pseudomonas aeruginosa]EKW6446990.1 ATP-dependent Clp protease ATP-binding subunit [Pseudomonas aeruginosa]